jgi:hypothetical protein
LKVRFLPRSPSFQALGGFDRVLLTDCVHFVSTIARADEQRGQFVDVPLFGFAEHTPKRAKCIVMVRRAARKGEDAGVVLENCVKPRGNLSLRVELRDTLHHGFLLRFRQLREHRECQRFGRGAFRFRQVSGAIA